MMSATVFAAVMFDICAFLPTCLSPAAVSIYISMQNRNTNSSNTLITITGACILPIESQKARSDLKAYVRLDGVSTLGFADDISSLGSNSV